MFAINLFIIVDFLLILIAFVKVIFFMYSRFKSCREMIEIEALDASPEICCTWESKFAGLILFIRLKKFCQEKCEQKMFNMKRKTINRKKDVSRVCNRGINSEIANYQTIDKWVFAQSYLKSSEIFEIIKRSSCRDWLMFRAKRMLSFLSSNFAYFVWFVIFQ